MLTINFYPDSDLEDYTEAITEYESVWREHGQAVISSWEKQSHHTFRETYINAIVSRHGPCHSHPLHLRSSVEPAYKKIALTHELGHRILQNWIERDTDHVESHQIMYLILGDVVSEVFGEKALAEMETWELSPRKPDFYRKAWEWALQFNSYEKRQAKLLELYENKPEVIE